MNGLVLSLFPGIGMLDMAFEQEGFCVVRGPDLLWGGDIKNFHPPSGKFDGVIGGPPCQRFSQLRFIIQHNGYELAPNLIPEYERIVSEAQPSWFLMEEVPAAPAPNVPGYIVHTQIVSDSWVGGATMRRRRISFGTCQGKLLHLETTCFLPPKLEPAVLASGGRRAIPVAIGGNGKPKRSSKSALANYGYNSAERFSSMIRLQGLPDGFLEEAPFTLDGKQKCIGNGVPLPMGRAIAKAIKASLSR